MTSFSLGCLQDLAFVSSFCSWGPCSQGEIHTRSWARRFSPFVERHDNAKWELNHFLSAAGSKSSWRRCQLFSLISALLPWDWQCRKVTCARNWCIGWEFLKPVFFLQPGPTGHPLCSAFPDGSSASSQGNWIHHAACSRCIAADAAVPLAANSPSKAGRGGSSSHPKSFMLSQQLAALTQNRCLKWDSSPLVFCLFIHQGRAPVPRHHLVTLWPSSLVSVAPGLRFSGHGAELRALTSLSLSWPLSLAFRRAGRNGNSLTQAFLCVTDATPCTVSHSPLRELTELGVKLGGSFW